MGLHKKELPYLPAVKQTKDGLSFIKIGNDFNSVRAQIDDKTAARIPDGTNVNIYIGWED